MVLYNLYIYVKEECIFQNVWNQKHDSKKEENERSIQQYGQQYTQQSFTDKFCIIQKGQDILLNTQVYSYSTLKYKVHILTTLTQIRFVILTDPEVSDAHEVLQYLYNLFTKLIILSPLYDPCNISKMDISIFRHHINQYFSQLPWFQ